MHIYEKCSVLKKPGWPRTVKRDGRVRPGEKRGWSASAFQEKACVPKHGNKYPGEICASLLKKYGSICVFEQKITGNSKKH